MYYIIVNILVFEFRLMDESSENQNTKGSKRQWTAEEDAILNKDLLQLLDDGWKTDAGTFKPGYTKVLEKYLHGKNPNCMLKANPHIESRVKRLKSQYSAIKDMMGASDFGWDDARKMIIVEKEVYSQWCKGIFHFKFSQCIIHFKLCFSKLILSIIHILLRCSPILLHLVCMENHFLTLRTWMLYSEKIKHLVMHQKV